MRTLRGGTVAVAGRGGWLAAAAGHAVAVQAASRVLTPLARRLPPRLLRRVERAWAAALRGLLRVDIQAAGLDLVDPGEQYVVAALHESAIDPLVVARLPLPLRWVVRSEIAGWPDVGPYLAAAGHVAADPEQPRRAARKLLRGAQEAFAAGESLGVFPQGTLLGIETAFFPGAARLAARFGRPLLPVVVTGTHRVWEHPVGSTLRFGVPVGLQVLPPVPPDRAAREWRQIERAMKAAAVGPGMPAPRRFVPDRDGWWPDYRFAIDPDYPGLAARAAATRSSAMRR